VTRDAILQVESLNVRLPAHYGETDVLESVSLDIAQGEALGLVGESGSGKTLLGLAVLGLLPPDATVKGSIRVAGEEVVGASESMLRRLRGTVVSLIYQDALSALNPNRRIRAHFADVWRSGGLKPRDGWTRAATDWCKRVSLRDADRVLDAYPHELSGGMRQRVLIALALFRSPQLLIADEPTTALDRVIAKEILQLLRDLQADTRTALLLVSHDLGAVRAVCERVAVLYAGQLCEVGAIDSVVNAPRHRYTEALIASVDSLRAGTYPLASIGGAVPGPADYPSGCRFRSRCPHATQECAGTRPHVVDDGRVARCFHPSGARPAVAAKAS
jgi:peptide/nickel transport system permease protein